MPQPLRKAFPKFKGPLHADGASYRADLAQHAMRLVTDWTNLDVILSRVFVCMLGSNPKPGALIFNALSGTNAKRDALGAVARHALTPEQHKLLMAIMSIYGKVSKQRNRVVHDVWMWSPELPDVVLLCDPADFMLHHATVIEQRSAPVSSAPIDDQKGTAIFPGISIYKQDDLHAIRSRISSLDNWLRRFLLAIDWAPVNQTTLTPDLVLQRLSATPELRVILDRDERSLRSTQPVRLQSPDTTPPQSPEDGPA